MRQILILMFITTFFWVAAESATAEGKQKKTMEGKRQVYEVSDPENPQLILATLSSENCWQRSFNLYTADGSTYAKLALSLYEQKVLQTDKNISKYVTNLLEILAAFKSVEKENIIFARDAGESPFMLTRHKGQKCLVTGYILHGNTYNTYKLSKREIAGIIISKIVVPIVYESYKAIENTDIEHYAILITYGTRNFTDNENRNKPETMLVILSKRICKKYINNEMTDQELIDKSFVMLSREPRGFGRINVTLK